MKYNDKSTIIKHTCSTLAGSEPADRSESEVRSYFLGPVAISNTGCEATYGLIK